MIWDICSIYVNFELHSTLLGPTKSWHCCIKYVGFVGEQLTPFREVGQINLTELFHSYQVFCRFCMKAKTKKGELIIYLSSLEP